MADKSFREILDDLDYLSDQLLYKEISGVPASDRLEEIMDELLEWKTTIINKNFEGVEQ